MNGDLRNDELLRSYLLGELSEGETDRLEESLLKNDELFELCEAVEADLLAAYDRGELTSVEEEQVRMRLASSPAGWERLAFARALNTAAREPQRTMPPFARGLNTPAQEPQRTMPPPLPFRNRVPLPRQVHHWVALAAAAVLLVAIGSQRDEISSWFTRSTPNEIGAGVTRPDSDVHQEAKKNLPPGNRFRKPPGTRAMPRIEPERQPQREERVARHEPVKAIIALSLATLRGAEDIQKFPIPPKAELVEVQVDLEGLEDYRSFDAAVKSETKGTVWEKKSLTPKRLDWGTALVLEVPAQHLTPGRYEVAVTAGAETLTQDFEVVGENQ
jgi:hypothetical protein